MAGSASTLEDDDTTRARPRSTPRSWTCVRPGGRRAPPPDRGRRAVDAKRWWRWSGRGSCITRARPVHRWRHQRDDPMPRHRQLAGAPSCSTRTRPSLQRRRRWPMAFPFGRRAGDQHRCGRSIEATGDVPLLGPPSTLGARPRDVTVGAVCVRRGRGGPSRRSTTASPWGWSAPTLPSGSDRLGFDHLTDAVDAMAAWPCGSWAVATVLRRGRRSRWGESRCAMALSTAGIRTVPQVEIRDDAGPSWPVWTSSLRGRGRRGVRRQGQVRLRDPSVLWEEKKREDG